jgi:hypothetical protein
MQLDGIVRTQIGHPLEEIYLLVFWITAIIVRINNVRFQYMYIACSNHIKVISISLPLLSIYGQNHPAPLF